MINKIEESIENYLSAKGINPANQGFTYLVEAIRMILEDATYKDNVTYRLYPDIAYKHKKSTSSIERAMRYSVNQLIPSITISKFLAEAVIRLRPITKDERTLESIVFSLKAENAELKHANAALEIENEQLKSRLIEEFEKFKKYASNKETT